MFPQTIKTKIILWFLFAMAGILLMFSLLVYTNLRSNLYADTDDLLELKAEGVVDYLEAYWKMEKEQALLRGEKMDLFLRINSLDFVEMAQRGVREIPVDPNLVDMSVQLFAANGVYLVGTKKVDGINRFPTDILEVAQRGKSFFLDMSTIPIKSRAIVVPVMEGPKILCLVLVSKPLTFVYDSLRRLKMILFFLWPLSLGAAGLTGLFLARVVLKPLRQIIRIVQQITDGNLKARVMIPDTKDEIKRLADTFNVMLDELDRSFTTQRQMVQDISHELRTPLTILKGEIEVALKKVRSTEEYTTTLASSLEEINRINRIVENLLTLARFDSQQVPFRFERTSLPRVLTEIADEVRVLVEQKKIRAKVSLLPEAWVMADEGHLRRAVLNLLDNAIKYTPEQGQVDLSMDVQGGNVCLRIADTGMGIAQQDLPFIFDRFYRVDQARSSKGFGLGLSLAKTIIEAHHGRIEVQSVVSQGTVFSIFLPLVP